MQTVETTVQTTLKSESVLCGKQSNSIYNTCYDSYSPVSAVDELEHSFFLYMQCLFSRRSCSNYVYGAILKCRSAKYETAKLTMLIMQIKSKIILHFRRYQFRIFVFRIITVRNAKMRNDNKIEKAKSFRILGVRAVC